MAKTTVRDAAFDAARAIREYPWRTSLASGGLIGLGALTGLTDWTDPASPWITGLGIFGATGMGTYWVGSKVMRPGTSKRALKRMDRYSQRHGGTASWIDIQQYASWKALRMQSRVIRPSLRSLSAWELWRLPKSELGILVLELGYGLWFGERVYSTPEDTSTIVGGPRVGKTALLATWGIDAPGGLVTTSTRSDLAEWVHPARIVDKDGDPSAVHTWNPSGYVDVPSTVRWRVLIGCEDYATALRRATAMLPSNGEGEHARWVQSTRPVLALFLHAAALGEKRMLDVLRWVGDEPKGARPGQPAQKCQAEIEIVEAVMSVPGGLTRAAQARHFFGLNDRTRTSITHTMRDALDWMSHDQARELGDAPIGTTTLDIARLIREKETLHLFGHESQVGLGPLNAALVDEITHQARVLAGKSPEGRLDPPLTLLLDEAALVCPVPLDKDMADMGGRGVTMHASVQSLAQLRAVWGQVGADVILGNTNNLLVFGGGAGAADLRDISTLTGGARYENLGEDHAAADSHRWTSVLDEAKLRSLGKSKVLLLRRGLMPIVGNAPRVFDRDVRTDEPWWKFWRRYRGIERADLSKIAVPEIPAVETLTVETIVEQAKEPEGGEQS